MGKDLPPDAARLRVVAEARLVKLSASAAQPTSFAGSSPTARTAALLRRSSTSRGGGKDRPAALELDVWRATGADSDTGTSQEAVADRGGGTGRPASDYGAMSGSGAGSLPPLSNNSAAHQASSSLGGSSDQASPRFLELLRTTLPGDDEDSGSGAASSTPRHVSRQQPVAASPELPSTLAMLHALNGSSSAGPGGHTSNGAAGAAANSGGTKTAAAAAAGGGKPHKRGFLGLFRSGKNSKAHQQQQQQQDHGSARGQPGDVGADSATGGGSNEGSNRGSRKKSGAGSWFGGSSSSSKSAPVSPAVPPPPRLPTPPAAGAAEAELAQHGGVLLPGLPLQVAPSLDGAASSTGSEGMPTAFAAAAASPTLPAGLVAAGGAEASAYYHSAPSSALPSPLTAAASLPPGVPTGKKPSHRRHRSLTSMLVPGWRRRSRQASAGSESELFGGDATPTRAATTPSRPNSPAPKSAEALAAAAAAGGYASCFGMASAVSADGEMVSVPVTIPEEPQPQPPLLPPGITGLRNIGNTCFVNVALQCLRYTPGLPLNVAPDLLERAAQQQQQQQAGGLQRGGDSGGGGEEGGAAAAAGGEFEPGEGEDVHEQALARASVDRRQQPIAEDAPAAATAAAAAVDGGAGGGAGGEAGGGSSSPVQAGSSGEQVEAAVGAGGPADGGDEAGMAMDSGGDVGAAGDARAALADTAGSTDAAAPADSAQLQQQQQEQQEVSASVAAAPAPQQQQEEQAPTPAPKPQRPAKGELLQAFADLVTELYLPKPSGSGGAINGSTGGNGGTAVCAMPLLRILRAFPIAADYFDGGQHDCQEVLRVVMDLLHEELNRVPPRQPQQPQAPPPPPGGEAEASAGGDSPAATGQTQQEQGQGQQGQQQAEGEEVYADASSNSSMNLSLSLNLNSAAAMHHPEEHPARADASGSGLQQQQDGARLQASSLQQEVVGGAVEGVPGQQRQQQTGGEKGQQGDGGGGSLPPLPEKQQRDEQEQPEQQQQVSQPQQQAEGEQQGGMEAEGQQVAEQPQQQQQQADEPPPPQQQQEQEGGAEREGQGKEEEAEDEGAKADRYWQQYLERDNSVITDLFGGQLQSSVTCHKCGGRFTMYEPFWDLSLPLAKESKGGTFSWLGLKGSTPASIQDCLTAFTADEKMEGAEAFHCERCGEKTPATKHLRLHRLPEVLVLHIKRFKYKGASTDKLTASVSFPLKGLRLHQFASPECPAGPDECCYDLYAVSNHYGNLSGGHYTAMCRVPQAGGEDAWYSFNDEQVTRVSPNQVVSQYAYILFYVRSRSSSAAHHRRNNSAASASALTPS